LWPSSGDIKNVNSVTGYYSHVKDKFRKMVMMMMMMAAIVDQNRSCIDESINVRAYMVLY